MDRIRRNLLIGGTALVAAALTGLLPEGCARPGDKGKSAVTGNEPPERPSGQPKPLLQEDITPVLARLDSWYAAHLPSDQYAFNPPATDARLDAFVEVARLVNA